MSSPVKLVQFFWKSRHKPYVKFKVFQLKTSEFYYGELYLAVFGHFLRRTQLSQSYTSHHAVSWL